MTDTTLHLSWVLTASYISNSVSKDECSRLFPLKSSGAKWTFWDPASPFVSASHKVSHHFQHCFIAGLGWNWSAEIKSALQRGSEAGSRKTDIVDSQIFGFFHPKTNQGEAHCVSHPLGAAGAETENIWGCIQQSLLRQTWSSTWTRVDLQQQCLRWQINLDSIFKFPDGSVNVSFQ